MVSTKIIYRTDKVNAYKEHPLYLRIIKNRKSQYISLGVYLLTEHWNDAEKKVRKSHPNAQRLNNYLAQKISDAQDVALDLETKDKTTTPREVKNQIIGRTAESFFTFGNRVIAEKEKTNTYGTYRNFKLVVSKVKTYMGKRDLLLDEITVHWLKNYEIYLLTKLENGINTVHMNLKTIRRILNEAINEELLPYEKNPFNRFKLKTENVQKNFLTEDELFAIENLPLEENSKIELTRNLYVFASYAAGLRISDVLQLKWKNFDGEKLLVHTQKTGTLVSVKLPTKALEIINLYKPEIKCENDFIFPLFNSSIDYTDKHVLYNSTQHANQLVNNNLPKIAKLAGITKHIHFHCSRHGFAVRALSKGMRIEYVSKLMGHTSIKTTQIYAKIVNEELDKAMEVFN